MAYMLVTALRRISLAGTELATATCGSIRLKLLKIGARSPWASDQWRLHGSPRSVRRIRIAMASSCPNAAAFRLAHARLCGWRPQSPVRP
jgi:Transposase DDE domain group 1